MNKILNDRTLHFLENRLIDELSRIPDLQNRRTVNSPRAVGDAVQDAVGELLPRCFPEGLLGDFSADFARRAMADIAFTDVDGNYYLIDVKTHNTSTQFNMPNLTSVHRLARFYEDDRNYFVILLIEYSVENGHLVFSGARFIPIEHLEWSCLTIGALGWGQIQIANSNIVHINRSNTRVDWMLSLCDVLDIFYPKEIAKITERIDYFQSVRIYWESRKNNSSFTI